MSVERGNWVKDDDIKKYIHSLPWNPGAFIRKEFEFTNWFTRGHEYLYAKKDLTALGEELVKRNIDCKRYKEFLDDKDAFDKRMAKHEETSTKKTPVWQIKKGLKNITTAEIPKPDPEKVRTHLEELKQEFRKNKFELYGWEDLSFNCFYSVSEPNVQDMYRIRTLSLSDDPYFV